MRTLRGRPPALQINQQPLLQVNELVPFEIALRIVHIAGDQPPRQMRAEGLQQRAKQRGATAVHANDERERRTFLRTQGCDRKEKKTPTVSRDSRGLKK